MASRHPGAPDQGPFQIGQTFNGQYEILALIGSGGHAFVYRARHRFLGHLVALKALHRADGVTLEMLRRGQAEAQIEFKLSHPGIVRVLDAGMSDDGLLYIAMEHLSGRSAREALQEYGKLGLREALHLGRCVAEALHVAHLAGVVHRDLKPENLFFTTEQIPKVLDFGVAKFDDIAGWQTRKESTVGTFLYMSPEQALGLPVSPRSDIYTAGLILWELLIGKHPVIFQLGERRMGFHVLANIICKELVLPVDSVDPTIPGYITELITQATAKAPEKRFASMLEFANAIRECERLLDAEEKRAGRVTTIRDLSRKVPGSSGVAQVSSSAPPPNDHDTVPASRVPFLGVLPSVRSPSAPPVAPATPPQSSPSGAAASSPVPSSSERPTMFSRTGAGNTAPLHAPSLAAAPSPGPASTPAPTSPRPATAGRSSAPPVAPAQLRPEVEQASPARSPVGSLASSQAPGVDARRAAQEAPLELPLKGMGIVPLLWGLAAGILIFGLGAAYFMHPKAAPSPAPSAAFDARSATSLPQRHPTLPVPPAAELPIPTEAPSAEVTAPATPAVTPVPAVQPAPAPKPAAQTKATTAKSASVTQHDIDKMEERLRSLEKKSKDSKDGLPDSGLPPPPPGRRQSVF